MIMYIRLLLTETVSNIAPALHLYKLHQVRQTALKFTILQVVGAVIVTTNISPTCTIDTSNAFQAAIGGSCKTSMEWVIYMDGAA